MLIERAQVLRFAIYIALYVLGAEFAVVFVSLPTDVTLIWPSAGLAFAVLLFHGPRWWPFIPLAILVTHLLISPAPPAFVPFSLASNTAATLLAVMLVRRLTGDDVLTLRVVSGLALLLGGALAALVSAMIGVSGMVATGMVAATDFWSAAGKWAAGDLFGIVSVTPFALMLMRALERRRLVSTPVRFAGWGERGVWLLASVGGVLLVVRASTASPAYAIGLSFLPLALLLWSALRFEPIITAGATMAMALTVVTLIGLGVGGFSAPSSLLENFVLLALLSLMAIVPQMVAAANYRMRAGAAEMLRRARSDTLTGLPNRTGFEETFRAVLDARPEIASGGAVAYIDLDQFKLVNDTASHAVGDEAIRRIAGILRARLPADAYLARLGADEFGILWADRPLPMAMDEAQSLRAAVAEFRFPHEDRVFSLTASIGLAPFPPRQADQSTLLRQADTACYAAKELGGNRVQVVGADDATLLERSAAMNWVVRLNDALDHDRFELWGQYILPASGGEPEGIEVLLRMRGADGTALLPGHFIPAAERFQLATRIDRWVVDAALRWLAQESQAARLRLNINLSAASLADEDFARFLIGRLSVGGVDPSRIGFEITETSAVRDLERTRRFIRQFKALGVHFALDDFGTGFCSFGYLRDLDVDSFKIDGSFIRDIDRNPLSLAIVRSIVEIARVLGKRTVAEAVEDLRLGTRTRELGVDAVQGYAYHRPEPLRLLMARAA